MDSNEGPALKRAIIAAPVVWNGKSDDSNEDMEREDNLKFTINNVHHLRTTKNVQLILEI